MGLSSLLKNIAETQELHSVQALRSRYYKANYANVKAQVLKYAEQDKMNVKNVDDVHKEILLQSNRYHIIVSIVQVSPIETSVDFKIEMYAMIGWGKPQKKLIEFYQFLDQNLQFKGVGLHP